MFENREYWLHFAAPASVLDSADDRGFVDVSINVIPSMDFRFLLLPLRQEEVDHQTSNNGSLFLSGDHEAAVG